MTEENKELKIGAKMTDGTIYAGISPDTKKPLYAMPEDGCKIMSDIVENALGDSMDVSEWENVSLIVSFDKAAEYATTFNKLNVYGHQDWRLPTLEELSLLEQGKNAGSLKGTFNTASGNENHDKKFYWSTTPDTAYEGQYSSVYVQSFENGTKCPAETNHPASVRFVRG